VAGDASLLNLQVWGLRIIAMAGPVTTQANRVTLLPYLVRKLASSMALSPPPMTASGLLRKIGAAPSHTAHAEMPCRTPTHLTAIVLAPLADVDVSRPYVDT
jgi:hypothetical protein